MKRLLTFITILFASVLLLCGQDTYTVSANNEDISQNLDLKIVAKLFSEANTVEQFEIMLNNPDSAYSNLDLNGDGQIDYLRVVEAGTNDTRIVVIQAVLAKDIYQDVASIYIEKNANTNDVKVQVIGDEYVYGTNYIIEPVYIYRPVIYNWLWSPRWYCWESPWYWGYWPIWWYYRPCFAYHWYIDRCHRFHCHHYCSFRYARHVNHNYHNIHRSVTRRDYANTRPDNSFNRRNADMCNARDLRSTSVRTRTTQSEHTQRTAVREQTNRTVSPSRTSTRSTSRTTTHVNSQQTSTNRSTRTAPVTTRTFTRQPTSSRTSNVSSRTSSPSTRSTSTRSSGSVRTGGNTSSRRR